jgi:hypothetical protein
MFVQIMEGQIRDPELLARQTERWYQELRPGAIGYLGSTSGTTADGLGILVARFESEEAARANSERPEQSAWWSETTPAFEGLVDFQDCAEVDVMLDGGSNAAGFVQIIQGRAKDPAAMRAAGQAMEAGLRADRPDVLGGIIGWHDDREFTQVVYFTSEAEARVAEAAATNDIESGGWSDMFDGPLTFHDLLEPKFD